VTLYTFGPFALDAAGFRLTDNGEPAAASPKVLDQFRHLLDHSSTLVTKGSSFGPSGPDVIVSDNALTPAVA
jgi:DNA-binding winged helix-turn-helix (wHTH) protein